MAGLGVSILSSHTLSYGGNIGLQELNVSRLPILLNWQLARLKSKRMSIIASTFLDYVNNQGRAKLLQDLAHEQPHMQRFFGGMVSSRPATGKS